MLMLPNNNKSMENFGLKIGGWIFHPGVLVNMDDYANSPTSYSSIIVLISTFYYHSALTLDLRC